MIVNLEVAIDKLQLYVCGKSTAFIKTKLGVKTKRGIHKFN